MERCRTSNHSACMVSMYVRNMCDVCTDVPLHSPPLRTYSSTTVLLPNNVSCLLLDIPFLAHYLPCRTDTACTSLP